MGFIGNLKSLISEIGLRAFSETVLRHEEASDIVECGGQLHRYKMDSDKEWVTPFGLAVVPRRYFQPDRGGEGGTGRAGHPPGHRRLLLQQR